MVWSTLISVKDFIQYFDPRLEPLKMRDDDAYTRVSRKATLECQTFHLLYLIIDKFLWVKKDKRSTTGCENCKVASAYSVTTTSQAKVLFGQGTVCILLCLLFHVLNSLLITTRFFYSKNFLNKNWEQKAQRILKYSLYKRDYLMCNKIEIELLIRQPITLRWYSDQREW